METPSEEEFVNEGVKGEESTAVKTPSMEECFDEENQVEVTSSVQIPPWRNLEMKRKNNMVKKNSKKELMRRILSFKKRNMKTLRFQLHPASFLPHCQFLCIISWSHHFNMQNENFPPPVILSTCASLCKHLTKTKKEDNTHGFEKGVQGKKRKERENEENLGRQKMFFGKSKAVKSSKDELCANLLTKQGNDERKQVSSNLPLHAGHDWYVEHGRNESKNRARLQSQTTNVIDTEGGSLLGTNRSTVSGTLQQNLEAIKEKIEEKVSWKEKSRLVGIKAVGEQIHKFPILSTRRQHESF